MDEDPFFYRKLSDLIEQAIEDYKNDRISEADYLKKMMECMDAVRRGQSDESPDQLAERDLARAIFGSLKEQIGPIKPGGDQLKEESPPYRAGGGKQIHSQDQLLAEAACHVEDIIRRHSIVGCRADARLLLSTTHFPKQRADEVGPHAECANGRNTFEDA